MSAAPKLEDFLAGKPLNPRMAALMKGEEEDDDQRPATDDQRPSSYADGTPVTDQEREHLRRMLGTAGWQVLLKLLDTTLQNQEDAARRLSLQRATPEGEITAAWKTVAANREARNVIVALAEAESAKGKRGKAGAPPQKRGLSG